MGKSARDYVKQQNLERGKGYHKIHNQTEDEMSNSGRGVGNAEEREIVSGPSTAKRGNKRISKSGKIGKLECPGPGIEAKGEKNFV